MDRGELESARDFVERALALAADFNVPKLLDAVHLFRSAVQIRQRSKHERIAHDAVAELRRTGNTSNLRSEDMCFLLDAYFRAGNREAIRWVVNELRRTAEGEVYEVRHPVRVAVALFRVAQLEGDEREAKRWIEAGKCAVKERLARFSKNEDREAYQKQPFVTALLDFAAEN